MAEPGRFDTLRTDRLVMRRWLDSDREPFAALNADPQTMVFFPQTLDREASDGLIDLIEERFDQQGYGLWALEVAGTGEFILQPHMAYHRPRPPASRSLRVPASR